MAGARFVVTSDLAAAREGLAKLRERGEDLLPAMDAIGGYLADVTRRRFETEIGPDGAKWTPSRRALKEGGQTLTDSARLRQSITHSAAADRVEVGSNVVYAAIHQFGGAIEHRARTQTIFRTYNARTNELSRRFVKRGRSNFASDHAVGAYTVRIPARPFLGLSPADAEEIPAIVARFIVDGAP